MVKCPENRSTIVGLVQINNSFAGQDYFPLSVGLLQTYVKKHAPANFNFEFILPIFKREKVPAIVDNIRMADVVGFSVYIWNLNISLEVAKRLKEKNKDVLIIFGGPQVPDKSEKFLKNHPFIDIVCHGEGEDIFLDILLCSGERDWRNVQSVSYLDSDGNFVHQPRRKRISDLKEIPSPYLEGAFDALLPLKKAGQWLGLWETNRGCPFGCAFCEWGAQSLNKVYSFDIERLNAEMKWFADHKVEFIFCCDANFGLLARDVKIARHVAETKRQTGYPHAFSVQSSKNATERVYQVQKILSQGGLSKGTLLALQSVNSDTLREINRANISLDTFDELQRRFRSDGILTFTDLIIGLPGETYDSYTDGVSTIMNKGQHNRIQFINLSILGNALMGQEEYQKRFGMQMVRSKIINIHGSLAGTEDGIDEYQDLVIATKDMPRKDWVRARVFSWMAAFLHFNKIFQVPLIVLHERCSVSYRDMIESFVESKVAQVGVIGKINTLFLNHARKIQKGGPEFYHSGKWLNIWWPLDEYALIDVCAESFLDSFYSQAKYVIETFFADRGLQYSGQLLDDAIKLNKHLVRLPFQNSDIDVSTKTNIWEFYQSVLTGNPVPLKDGTRVYRISCSMDTWNSWGDWCREVVWYGNKKGAYMYDRSLVKCL